MATKKILFVTLTNIGDVILTLPSLDFLRERFPGARFTVICGPRAAGFFASSPAVERCIPYDKHAPLRAKIRLFRDLRKERFDLVVDFRNSLFGWLLNPICRAPFIPSLAGIHAYRQYLEIARAVAGGGGTAARVAPCSIFVSPEDKARVEALFAAHGCAARKIIAVSPGCRGREKRWSRDNFRELCGLMAAETGSAVVLLGDGGDTEATAYIAGGCRDVIDLAGKTTLAQLAYVLTRSELLVANDSANMHLAGYLDVPTVAILGPTDERRYGPWAGRTAVARRGLSCSPCPHGECARGRPECMEISAGEVMARIRRMRDNG